jgi:starvation-inducible outer membrane lipoprotein
VTVVGPITGTVEGKIGSTPYKFMTMQVNGYKRWRLEQQVIMPPAYRSVDVGPTSIPLRLSGMGLV